MIAVRKPNRRSDAVDGIERATGSSICPARTASVPFPEAFFPLGRGERLALRSGAALVWDLWPSPTPTARSRIVGLPLGDRAGAGRGATRRATQNARASASSGSSSQEYRRSQSVTSDDTFAANYENVRKAYYGVQSQDAAFGRTLTGIEFTLQRRLNCIPQKRSMVRREESAHGRLVQQP